MKQTIHVTDRHIERGEGRDNRGCAIAVAVEEVVPQYEIHVGRMAIAFKSLLDDSVFHAFHGLEITRFIDAFDRWKDGTITSPRPEPISFEIEIPDQDTPVKADCASVSECSNAQELAEVTK